MLMMIIIIGSSSSTIVVIFIITTKQTPPPPPPPPPHAATALPLPPHLMRLRDSSDSGTMPSISPNSSSVTYAPKSSTFFTSTVTRSSTSG
jgi:hypothetical protein